MMITSGGKRKPAKAEDGSGADGRRGRRRLIPPASPTLPTFLVNATVPGELVHRARPNLITWEKGRSSPSPRRLVALAKALAVEPWQLTTVSPESAELADLRAWAGLSQQELADRAGLVRATYALVERAELPLRHDVARGLARALRRRIRDVEEAYNRTAARRAADAASG